MVNGEDADTISIEEAQQEWRVVIAIVGPLSSYLGICRDEFDLISNYALANQNAFILIIEKYVHPWRDRIEEEPPAKDLLSQDQLASLRRSLRKILSFYDNFQRNYNGFKFGWW
jgi:hypothetical protein